jgi:hypothetical protein
MKSILDELAGVLSPAELAKIKADAGLSERITKGADELYGYYKDDTIDPPTATATPTSTTTTTAPVVTTTVAPSGDLGAILRTLDGVTRRLEAIGDVPKMIESKVEEVVKARGDELVSAVATRALRQADELAKAREDWNRNFSEGGKKQFDTEAFEKFVNEQTAAGTRFASVTKAYESFTAPQREEVTVETKVRDRLKERNSGHVPGVTPTTANTTLAVLMARGRDKDGNGETAVNRAGASLDARLHGNE